MLPVPWAWRGHCSGYYFGPSNSVIRAPSPANVAPKCEVFSATFVRTSVEREAIKSPRKNTLFYPGTDGISRAPRQQGVNGRRQGCQVMLYNCIFYMGICGEIRHYFATTAGGREDRLGSSNQITSRREIAISREN